ncbi:MAG: DUF2269 domain-containing protein [Proteobacteria bacterium]|nr:DUF2269 domain-containing protein [Pseudomonadota bacterium]
MDNYSLLKLIHIISATVLAGTGAGSAFFMLMAYQSKNIQAIAVTTKHVVLADWIFTTPAVIIQLVTGILLMKRLNYSFTSTWFYIVISLFIFIGLCWLPVVYIQYKLKDKAIIAIKTSTLEPGFNALIRLWTCLGILAFSSILIVFWLMVYKPFPIV